MNIDCEFVSVWDSGREIKTKATYDVTSGHVRADVTKEDVSDLDILTREYIEIPGGGDIEICLVCHKYTLKTTWENFSGNTSRIKSAECPKCGKSLDS